MADERFLVLINNLLASGEIPDLFSDDEVKKLQSKCKSFTLFRWNTPEGRESWGRFYSDRPVVMGVMGSIVRGAASLGQNAFRSTRC